MKKKILILFILLNTSLVLSQTFNYNGINYAVTDTVNFYVKVGSNSSFNGVATIPETVSYNFQNYTVTEIGYEAFRNCTGLTSFTIPNSITNIEGYAFYNCSGLTSITIPNSVTVIGNASFFGCTGLTSLSIPSSVTTIDDLAFCACTGLTSLSIPSPSTFINYQAFSGCTGLTSLNLTSPIGIAAFYQCTNLVSVTINTNGFIGTNAFYQCTALTTLTITSAYGIGDNAFSGCSSLNTVNCYITTPLSISYNVFSGVNVTSCTLNVPLGSETAYEATSVWTDFNPINGNLLATDNFVIKDNIQLYPNPTKNELFIDMKNLTNTQLEVMDITGKVIFNEYLNSNSTIDTSNLKNGIYLFKLTSDNGSVITKVVKN
ncbi:MAG: leucine-rich repeat protein [Flavobacterium sp.]